MKLTYEETLELLNNGKVVLEREEGRWLVFYDRNNELNTCHLSNHAPLWVSTIELNIDANVKYEMEKNKQEPHIDIEYEDSDGNKLEITDSQTLITYDELSYSTGYDPENETTFTFNELEYEVSDQDMIKVFPQFAQCKTYEDWIILMKAVFMSDENKDKLIEAFKEDAWDRALDRKFLWED